MIQLTRENLWMSYSFYTSTADFIIPVDKREIVDSLYFFSILLLNLVSYIYIWVKFYKVLCYSKLTCEWFPMINPYQWPFSFFQTMTAPYFRFWAKVLPNLKFQKSSLEISGIIALEALNTLIYFCVRSVNILITLLEDIEKTLP